SFSSSRASGSTTR
ncbi:Nucleoside triphosphate pyrophosphohydrolase, partial [Haemophilus influenzae]